MNRTPPRRSPRFQNEDPNVDVLANTSISEANVVQGELNSQTPQTHQSEIASQATCGQHESLTVPIVTNMPGSNAPSDPILNVVKVLQEKILDLEHKLRKYELRESSTSASETQTLPQAVHTPGEADKSATVTSDVPLIPITSRSISTSNAATATKERCPPAILYSSVCPSTAAKVTAAVASVSHTAALNANQGQQVTVPIAVSVSPPTYLHSINNAMLPLRVAEVQSTYTIAPPPVNAQQPFCTNIGAFVPISPASAATNNASGYLVPRKLQDLPDFGGQPEDWPMFFTAFQQSTQAYGYTNWENMQRLQKCLKGSARDLVKCLLIHPENVDAILEHLSSRFGRPEQLIYSQLAAVREVLPISENAISKLVPFSTKVKNFTAFLQSVNGTQHLSNPILLNELVAKLPMSKRVEWASFSSSMQPYPTVAHFSSWLSHIADLIFAVQGYDSYDAKRRVVLHTNEEQASQTEEMQQTQPEIKQSVPKKCPICSSQHKLTDCRRFIEASVGEKWKEAKRHKLCFSCLGSGHSTRDCRRRKSCSIDGCKRKHHQMLHDKQQAPKTEPASKQPNKPQGLTPSSSSHQAVDAACGSILSCSGNKTDRKLLFRVLPVTLYGKDKHVETYALMDEGSSVTMMDNSIAEELGLNGQSRNLNVRWYGGRDAQETATVVNLQVSGAGLSKRHHLNNVYSVSNLELPSQSLCETELRSASCRAQQLPIQPYTGAVPKILVGLDHCHLGLPSEVMKISRHGPFAANTELGWCVFGPTTETSPRSTQHVFLTKEDDSSLHDAVASFFETENFGVRPSPPLESKLDARAKCILRSTTRRVNGRFETGLLWSQEFINLPDSYPMARQRLVSIERKMRRNEEFSKAYRNIINSYIHKGYARKLSPDEAAVIQPRTWYLPHFGVINPNKPGKLRLVFDAAAEVDGKSLNSYLMKGPQDYRPLPAILFHFREGAVAICGDVKEMFHQIIIRAEDRCAQRFLWRDGRTDLDPDTYEMKVMTFGAACSPCAAQYVKIQNALEHKSKADPRAIKAVTDYHYVDDYVDSFKSVEEAIRISKQVKAIHQAAGFELRNFSSNESNVVRALDGTNSDISITTKEGVSGEKVLGMYWEPTTDSFKFELRFHGVNEKVIKGERRPTKRELLSIVMSIFDPLGFLSNITISAKIILQQIWKRKLSWDEQVPDDINVAWERWRRTMSAVMKLNIPRFYFGVGAPQELQLHVFVDASEMAFSAVVYWRIKTSSGEVDVSFICAKSRCSPLKPLTIPRLELQAAVLGTRLLKTIQAEHAVVAPTVVLWTDSKTVIKWLNSEHRRYKQFVAHRVSEILSMTKPENWRWIPTAENVADEATRANLNVNCCSGSRWFRGPQFLRANQDTWRFELPISADDRKDDEELRSNFILTVSNNAFISFHRFSSLSRLARTMAWVVRFVNNVRHHSSPGKTYGLTSTEVEEAKVILYRVAQRWFESELERIQHGLTVSRTSQLYKVLPYVDERGVLRARGRIDAASWLPLNARRPIILPADHPLTRLIVSHHHNQMKHQNEEATIWEIRRQYLIPRIRKVLRSVVAQCQTCKINKAAPVTPVMGPLPVDRLTPYVRPFSYTGLDYFGPINVTIGRRLEKRWVALFTCLSVRAIHLELAYNLSTDACILAIRNFINRRGVPIRMRSDNGKNFIGVDQEAKRFDEVFECARIQNELTSKGIEWLFNCPINPSEGGVWERLVQSVKRVLRHTLKEVSPREHTLISLLIEAENIVNSRPLTHLPIDVDQEEPLTPNHFLLGAANTTQTPSIDRQPDKICALRKQWRISRQLRDHFWRRWVIEYLPTLTRRSKWCQPTKPLNEGDLVFICDPAVPRRQWSRGIIEKLYPGKDGVARQADIRTAQGNVLRRAASKLAVLNVDSGEADRFTGGGMSSVKS